MDSKTSTFFLILFPVLFAGFWFLVTTVLMSIAGWFDLARKYPGSTDTALLKLRFQSGRMGQLFGGVSMSGILRLEACQTGLRVGIWKLFGPFCRDFFVPWNEIQVKRGDRFVWKTAELIFGGGPQSLVLMDYTANRLARTVPGRWPETGSFAKDTVRQAAWGAFKIWAIGMAFFGAFFTIVPWLLSGEPVPEMLVPCAILTSIAALIVFTQRIRA